MMVTNTKEKDKAFSSDSTKTYVKETNRQYHPMCWTTIHPSSWKVWKKEKQGSKGQAGKLHYSCEENNLSFGKN